MNEVMNVSSYHRAWLLDQNGHFPEAFPLPGAELAACFSEQIEAIFMCTFFISLLPRILYHCLFLPVIKCDPSACLYKSLQFSKSVFVSTGIFLSVFELPLVLKKSQSFVL